MKRHHFSAHTLNGFNGIFLFRLFELLITKLCSLYYEIISFFTQNFFVYLSLSKMLEGFQHIEKDGTQTVTTP